MPRYTAVAIVLHWAIAAAIIANLALGWWMHEAIDGPGNQAGAVAAFQVHKSIGLTVLVLSLLRLGWRLAHPPPALPASMPAWEKRAAAATHWAFYCLMLAIPLSGWLYVSTQWRDSAPLQVPTLWFGLFEVPHLFALDEAARELRQTLAGLAFNAHWYLAWGTAALLVLHVVAALKHQFLDRDEVPSRMLPALEPDHGASRSRPEKITLRGGLIAIVIAAVTITLTQFQWLDNNPTESETRITAAEGAWSIDPAASSIHFSGVHAGDAFRGRFTRWQADIRIDTENVTQSRIAAKIATASATDGIPLHDKTLPQAEWFNSAQHPYARYQATHIRPLRDNRYAVEGTLTIKDNPIQVPELTLTVMDNKATIEGQFKIDRKAADLGMESDPRGQWVSRDIALDVRARLNRR